MYIMYEDTLIYSAYTTMKQLISYYPDSPPLPTTTTTHIHSSHLPQCEIDSTGKPLDTLTPYAQQLIKAHGCQNTMVSEIVSQRNKAVFTAIHDGVDRANGRATSEAERVGTGVYHVIHKMNRFHH